MPSVPKRPVARKFNSLSCRNSVAGEMARSLRTASPEVSREQARYRRLMQLNSLPSSDIGQDDDSLSPLLASNLILRDDSASISPRPTSQHWPRKLEPLPGRVVAPVAGGRVRGSFPSEQVDQVLALEVPKQENNSWNLSPNQNLHHNVDNLCSHDRSCPELSKLIDKEINLSLSTSENKTENLTPPWCVATATLAALLPLESRIHEDSSTCTPITLNAVESVTAVATAAVGKKRQKKPKLMPISNDVGN